MRLPGFRVGVPIPTLSPGWSTPPASLPPPQARPLLSISTWTVIVPPSWSPSCHLSPSCSPSHTHTKELREIFRNVHLSVKIHSDPLPPRTALCSHRNETASLPRTPLGGQGRQTHEQMDPLAGSWRRDAGCWGCSRKSDDLAGYGGRVGRALGAVIISPCRHLLREHPSQISGCKASAT